MRREISIKIRELKAEYNARGEVKWIKVSPAKEEFYSKLIELFFSTNELNFRGLIVTDKEKLDHSYFNQGSHDSFYYKMYYYLLRNILLPENKYQIYLDIKDTRSQLKIEKLREILCNTFQDFDGHMICRMQHIRSHESEILQLADFLLGAVAYGVRGLTTSKTKVLLVKKITTLCGTDITQSTPPWEEKFNLFVFSPKQAEL